MSDQQDWITMNDQHLAATVAWLRLRLRQLLSPEIMPQERTAGSSPLWFKRNKKVSSDKLLPPPSQIPSDEELARAAQKMTDLEGHNPPPALLLLAERLGLSLFERQVLALCTAMEIDTRISRLCAEVQGDLNKPYPTFALAFTLFKTPDWAALAPNAPLRHWRLLEINQPGALPLTAASLRADERIVNYLKGLNLLDDRLLPLLDPMQMEGADIALPSSQQQSFDDCIRQLQRPDGAGRTPVVGLLGSDSSCKRSFAQSIAKHLGLSLYKLDLRLLPEATADFEHFTRLWQRESRLMPLALFIETQEAKEGERSRLNRFLERTGGLIFLDEEEGEVSPSRRRLRYEIGKPTQAEQALLWSSALEGETADADRLAAQFDFNQTEIHRIAETACTTDSQDKAALDDSLWQACRAAARPRLEQLAQRIEVKATWDELVLPSEEKGLLKQIIEQVAHRKRVYDDWGFREKMNRGLGINALFAGDSGTGKTMAAEVIAHTLKLDLYRIDLSGVVSKYIGETEKNLRKLFDAAEESGAILFFDEADALFGKRSEVKDSHDRYANIEINYLLQRMESYRGLAILATNMKSALDKAFVRRLRFIVNFPFPGIAQRTDIWKRVFPMETPVNESLDYTRLAKLNLTGGSIHSVAMNAAFLAAQDGGSVTMPILLNAARAEFKKLERPAKESDFRWLERTGVML